MRFLFLCFLIVCQNTGGTSPPAEQEQPQQGQESVSPGQTVHGGGMGIQSPGSNRTE